MYFVYLYAMENGYLIERFSAVKLFFLCFLGHLERLTHLSTLIPAPPLKGDAN